MRDPRPAELQRQYMRDGQPYSKSHMKRLKRKARDQLAGGDLASLAAQLADGDGDGADSEDEAATSRRSKAVKTPLTPEEKAQRAADQGKIGQGTGRTLKEDQRRKQMYVLVQAVCLLQATPLNSPLRSTINRTHMAAVLQNPAFKQDPFAAIRLHAANSLAMQSTK